MSDACTAARLHAEAAVADTIADEWCTLLGTTEQPHPFQQPAWHAVWWRHFGGTNQPLTLTIRDGGRLVAVAPLQRSGDQLRFASDPNICDYMDFIVAADAPDSVYDCLLDAIAAEPWEEVVLWGLPDGARTLRVLPALATARGWRVEEEFEAVCPRITLPATWDEYLASLNKKDRHELRRKMRRFVEAGAGMTLSTVSSPAEVQAGLDDFIRLHVESRHDKRDFMTEEMERFFRDMAVSLAERDMVRLFFIEMDGRRVAGLLAFDTGSELQLYNSGYDPSLSFASVGIVSKALALQTAIHDGKQVYDFLRGAEPYKYDLGAKDREVHTLTLRRPPP